MPAAESRLYISQLFTPTRMIQSRESSFACTRSRSREHHLQVKVLKVYGSGNGFSAGQRKRLARHVNTQHGSGQRHSSTQSPNWNLSMKSSTYIARFLDSVILYRLSVAKQDRMHFLHIHGTILRRPTSLERSPSAYKRPKAFQFHLSQDRSSTFQVSCNQSTITHYACPNQKV